MAHYDAQRLIHSHTTAGMAAQGQDQLPLNQMSMQFLGRTSCHDYQALHLQIAATEVRDLMRSMTNSATTMKLRSGSRT